MFTCRELPALLLTQSTVSPPTPKGRHGKPHARVSRKDQRKLSRQQQKSRPLRIQVRKRNTQKDRPSDAESEDSDSQSDHDDGAAAERNHSSITRKPADTTRKLARSSQNPLKRPIETPIAPPPKRSRKLQEDDAEILALEKKLGIKTKKLPKAFEHDGLGDLLGDLDAEDGDDTSVGRNEDREWLDRKRKRSSKVQDTPAADRDDDDDDDDIPATSDDDDQNMLDDDTDAGLDSGMEDSGMEDELDHDEPYGASDDPFDMSDGEAASQTNSRPMRENPYVAPGAEAAKASQKYVPPSLRVSSSADAEANARLKRQIQGLLNRLSDANMLSILTDTERIYGSSPRQYVTTILLDLLMGLISDRSILENTFLILHAGFIAALYKTVGPDFGAQLVERIVQGFDDNYTMAAADTNAASGDAKNKCINIISLFTNLYNFQVVSSALLFDYIRLFLGSLSEVNTELLLRIVRLSGSQLRSDDPSSLKEIVLSLQKTVTLAGEASLSVRTSYMLETITDLKNNRLKTGAAGDQIRTEHAQRMKKTLGTLSSRPNLKAVEPLRISLADIRDLSKKGKWWLVGASWKGNLPDQSTQSQDRDASISQIIAKEDRHPMTQVELSADTAATSLDSLARASGMNTSVRRAIFISIMSASDYIDAHHRLLRLALSKAQQPEIPRVLLHCAGAEQRYNPYYTLIAKRLCAPTASVPNSRNRTVQTRFYDPDDGESGGNMAGPSAKMQKAFQFALWDLFTRMGEGQAAATAGGKDDDDDGDDEGGLNGNSLTTATIVNLAKMYGALVAGEALPLSILRKLDMVYLRRKARVFVEVLLLTVILSSKPTRAGTLAGIFEKAREADGLAVGLQWFLKKVVSRADLAGSEREKKIVQRECRRLVGVLAGHGYDGAD